VPTVVAVFPGDGTNQSIAERQHNLVRWTEYDRGGHFAALQAPELLVDDIRAFVPRPPLTLPRSALPRRCTTAGPHGRRSSSRPPTPLA
jgi:hypothetical protein